MKTKHFKFFAFTAIVLILGVSAHAEDLRKIVFLSGNWKFSIGDDSRWANTIYDDSDWEQITVPGQWENQGYNDYNGYAWYRKSFRVRDIPVNTTIYLMLGRIDDVDVVYLNGKEIGSGGKFPPNYETDYNRIRKYTIPADYLKEDNENVIAVKVYDSFLEGTNEIKMSYKEFEILHYLYKNAGKTIHRDDLISSVWSIDYDITTRTVDNFILKLRQKIEADSINPKIILTVHGIGYKMIVG